MKEQKIINIKTISILLALCLNYIGIGLVFPLFPQMCFDTSPHSLLPLSTSNAERSAILGILLSLMPLTQFFFSSILGSLSDTLGRKIVLIKSLLGGSIGYVLGAYAVSHSSLTLLCLSRILVGIATSNSSVLAATLADISSKENRSSYFSYYGISVSIGMALGPFLGSILCNKSLGNASYSFPFWAASVMVFINLLAVIFFFPKSTQSIKEQASHKASYTGFFQDKKILLFFCTAFSFYFGWTFFWEFLSVTLMHTMEYPAEEVGNIYALGAISQVVFGCLVTKTLVTRLPIAKLLPISFGALAVLVSLVGVVSTKAGLFSLIVTQQFFISCISPLLSTYVSKHAPQDSQGRALGLLTSTKSAAYTLGPLLSGLLFSYTPNMPVIVGGASLFCAVCASCMVFQKKPPICCTAEASKNQPI